MNDYSCELRQNELGLYDLEIRDGLAVIVSLRNIPFGRAIVEIEDRMHTTARRDGV